MRLALHLITSSMGLAAQSMRNLVTAQAHEPKLPRAGRKRTTVAAMRRAARKRRNIRRNPRAAR